MTYEGKQFSEPLFEVMSEYPTKFAHPVYLGESPHDSDTAVLASGTGVFIRFDGKLVGVTCQHVLASFRKRREANPRTIFAFGRLVVDAESLVLDESRELDLVTFDFTKLSGRLADRGRTVEPTKWPPEEITLDDAVAFAGFPGEWREQPAKGEMTFHSFASGASPIRSVHPTYFYTRLEIDSAIRAGVGRHDLGPLGGLSGGPVFVWRRGPVLRAELVGFVTEYSKEYDLFHVRRSTCIASDGTLIRT
jgi:Trypsin-like peptidase domain